MNKIQIEALTNELYKELCQKQNEIRDKEIEKEGQLWLSKYKKTLEYKEYLKLAELNKIEGIDIRVNNNKQYSLSESSYYQNLPSEESLIRYYGEKNCKTEYKHIDKSAISNKIIISTINGFDMETLKQELFTLYNL